MSDEVDPAGVKPLGAETMVEQSRQAIPAPADEFLINIQDNNMRLHFFDTAGDPTKPILRSSVLLTAKVADELHKLLGHIFELGAKEAAEKEGEHGQSKSI